jgi:probable HAF family extracellular repeat protein
MNTLAKLTSIMALPMLLAACGGGSEAGDSANVPPASYSSQSTEATLSTVPDNFPYVITLLGTLDGDSYAVALNDQGQVAGNYLDRNGNTNAFIWSRGTMRRIMAGGQASGINNRGQLAGWREAAGQTAAFVHDPDSGNRLLDTGGPSLALAINDVGQVAGRLALDPDQAFVEDHGRLQIISGARNAYVVAMNNVGQYLVKEIVGAGFRTLLWDQDRLIDLGDLGDPCIQGQDLNDAGQVVGWAQTATGEYHAFLWENGVMTDLAPLVGNFSSAVAIDLTGRILLKNSTPNGDHSYIYRNGQITDLGTFGSSYAVATDLNNNGQIAGWLATDSGGIRAFLATPRE